ncbi:MAG: hypothetical protein CMJ75_14075 [Planctomycetaceae bacterium]|nr:hypothetical protein [Planctomycetaceae bacterium]
MSIMQMVYQAGLNNGLSANQARAFTAEVGRENDYNPDYIFGEHRDSQRDNVGIISWNQGRRNNLYDFLKKKGVKVNGRQIERSQRALDAQMQFAIQEMKTNPSYKMTKKLFLDNPDVSYRTAEKVLGKNFIRWDYAGNSLGANVRKHHAKRDKYYAKLGGIAKNSKAQDDFEPQPLSDNWDDFKAQFEPQQPEPLSDNWANFKAQFEPQQPEPLSDDWDSFSSQFESAQPEPQGMQPLSDNWDNFKLSLTNSEPQAQAAPMQLNTLPTLPTLTIDEQRTING